MYDLAVFWKASGELRADAPSRYYPLLQSSVELLLYTH
jgi:hypothetical protein